MPPSSTHDEGDYHGAGLTNLDYALCSEQMGRVSWASEVFNCSAPDTGNMEVLHRYGSAEQKAKWLKPLLNGEIRSAFLMTEPAVASSDATNIETSIVRDGGNYVINGRKWWSSGLGDPRCKIAIVMGKTDPSRARHEQQSRSWSRSRRLASKFCACCRCSATTTRRTATLKFCSTMFAYRPAIFRLGEGRGFEIAQGRLGPGRIHHCMRTIGAAEVALEKMTKRLIVAFRLWQKDRGAIGVGATHRGSAHRHRDDAFALPEGRRHHGQAGNKTAQLEIAMIKVAAPRIALRIIDDAIQAHGGMGVTTDAGLAKSYAHIRTLRLTDSEPDESTAAQSRGWRCANIPTRGFEAAGPARVAPAHAIVTPPSITMVCPVMKLCPPARPA